MGDLAALIERVEKLDGPDKYIDFLIEQAILGYENLGGGYRRNLKTGERERFSYTAPSPPYTASIDAALLLVPEGWDWEVDSEGEAWCWPPGSAWGRPEKAVGIDPMVMLDPPRALPPALALTTAALRARQADG